MADHVTDNIVSKEGIVKGSTAMYEATTTVPRRRRNDEVVQVFLGSTDFPGESRPVQQGIEQSVTAGGLEADTEIIIGFLNNALYAAIVCILSYKRHYFMTVGIGARRAKDTFFQHVTEEQVHAEQLARRIVELGGEAVLSREQLLNRSYAEQVEEESLAEMISADLLAERSAIHYYRAMIASIGADDPTTREMLERIMARKEAHAKNLVSLLSD